MMKSKEERVIRHHRNVVCGICIVAISHVFTPFLTEYVSICVSLYWAADPTLEG